MNEELRAGGDKLYLTITTKPLAIAAAEHLPAVETTILVDTILGDDLLLIVKASQQKLEVPA